MSTTTNMLILNTFGDQLEQMAFEKITVSGIIKACGISRNTFYYHYEDIYDLLDHWLEQELGKFTNYSSDEEWAAAAKVFLHSCKSHKKMVYHLFDSLSRDRLERYVFTTTDSAIIESVTRRAEGVDLSPQRLRIIADISRYAIFGYFIRFLWNGMSDDIDKSVDDLSRVFTLIVDQAIAASAAEEAAGRGLG